MTVHTIAAVQTARYVVLGAEGGPVREVWLACHGYGQLAPYFARHFRAVAAPGRLVVVPEALSRFYVDGAAGRYERVGASWATRETRDTDVADAVRYLDDVLVAACAAADADPRAVPLVAFGFSQGTATAVRWLARSPLAAARPERARQLILWGGGLPAEVDPAAERAWLPPVVLVAGDRDPLATPARVMQAEARLRDAGAAVRVVSFPGEHRLNEGVLRALAAEAA